MTKCAGCRVRHLNCDAHSICTECKKSDRECVRLNVRFRHLVCPSQRITRADYGKYEFFFDREQTWVNTNGKFEFVTGCDSSLPTDEPEHNVLDAVGLNVETPLALVEQPSSTFVLRSASHTPTIEASVLDDEPPEYLVALEQAPHDAPGDVFLDEASEIPAPSLNEASQPGDSLFPDTNTSNTERMLPSLELTWPLKSVQEGKLVQHFVTHLAPWVCTGLVSVGALADSDISSTLAIAKDTSARSHPVWQRQVLY